MTIWLISDTHFGHYNIIKYCSRPFESVSQMDESMIANWNSVVKPNDHIYHLGDVDMRRGGHVQREAFMTLMKRLNGHKRLILGNHDHFPIKTYTQVFEKVVGTGRWLGNMILSHYPIHPGSMGGAKACIHGHTHNNQNNVFKPVVSEKFGIQPYINVCVEVINYTPVTLEDVQLMVKKQQ